MTCPKCGVGMMEEKKVNPLDQFDAIFHSLPLKRKILFILFHPPVWQAENKIARILLLQYPTDIRWFVCSECGFTDNTYFPVLLKHNEGKKPSKLSMLYFFILVTIGVILFVLISYFVYNP